MLEHFQKLQEVATDLRQERNDSQEALTLALRNNQRLTELLAAQRRYIEALERQLEPGVIAEIKDELEALDRGQEEAG